MKLKNDLQNFLDAYGEAANKRNFDFIEPMISKNAIYWFSDGSFNGIKEIRKAFEETWKNLPNETYSISDIKWLIQTEKNAVCVYKFTSESINNSKKAVFHGRGTNILENEDGKWVIVHEHLSLEPKRLED